MEGKTQIIKMDQRGRRIVWQPQRGGRKKVFQRSLSSLPCCVWATQAMKKKCSTTSFACRLSSLCQVYSFTIVCFWAVAIMKKCLSKASENRSKFNMVCAHYGYMKSFLHSPFFFLLFIFFYLFWNSHTANNYKSFMCTVWVNQYMALPFQHTTCKSSSTVGEGKRLQTQLVDKRSFPLSGVTLKVKGKSWFRNTIKI